MSKFKTSGWLQCANWVAVRQQHLSGGADNMQTSLIILASMLVLTVLYVVRYRNHDEAIWSAPAAWSRAAIYFCFCLLVADLSGAL
jgi:hypothetical protein